VVLCVGQLMIALDATVVNVALPSIQRELHFSAASLAWVLNAYLLTFGGLLLLAGRIGDLIGRKNVFLAGLALFVASSMLCGLASSAAVLIVARFVQGAGAAMVAAMVLGILAPTFPERHERTVALSVFAFVAVGGNSLGLVLGGALTDLLSWHWIFFINLPFGILSLVFATRLLEQVPGVGLQEGADVLGALLVTIAPSLAVYGLINAGSDGWGSLRTLGPLAAALTVAAVFVPVERRVRAPLIPLSIFRHRGLVSATTVRMIFPMGGFGFNFLGAQYLQRVLGYNPLVTGLAFLPGSFVTAIISLTMIRWLMRRFGPKSLVVAGLALVTVGLGTFVPAPVHASFALNVLPVMLLTGAGFGILFMPSISIAMSDVAPNETGLASGLTNVAPQIGASVSVAALATFSASRTTALLAHHQAARVALSGGYRLGIFLAACCTAASLVVALILLRSDEVTPSAKVPADVSALATDGA
jgi:EmrB/QacA subfamily drug resistance transporter